MGEPQSAWNTDLPDWLTTLQLYLLVLPLHRPLSTPPWSAALVYVFFAIGGLSQIAMRFYVRAVTGHAPYWASGLWFGLQIFQTLASIAALSIIASLHLAPPAVISRLVSPHCPITQYLSRADRTDRHSHELHQMTSSPYHPGSHSRG